MWTRNLGSGKGKDQFEGGKRRAFRPGTDRLESREVMSGASSMLDHATSVLTPVTSVANTNVGLYAHYTVGGVSGQGELVGLRRSPTSGTFGSTSSVNRNASILQSALGLNASSANLTNNTGSFGLTSASNLSPVTVLPTGGATVAVPNNGLNVGTVSPFGTTTGTANFGNTSMNSAFTGGTGLNGSSPTTLFGVNGFSSPLGSTSGLGGFSGLNSGLTNSFGTGLGSGLTNSFGAGLTNSFGTGLINTFGSGLLNSVPSGLTNSFPSGLTNTVPTGLTNSVPTGFGAGLTNSFGTGLSSGLAGNFSPGFNSGIGSNFGRGINSGLTSSFGAGLNSGIGSTFGRGFNPGFGNSFGMGTSAFGMGMGMTPNVSFLV